MQNKQESTSKNILHEVL